MTKVWDMGDLQYAVLVRPLAEEDGGGWEVIVPDLPGCMSDGETQEQALENVAGAIEAWKEEAERLGRAIPKPNTSIGQWRQRVPRTLHETLKQIADAEGVSLNQLVTCILAASVQQRFGSQFGSKLGRMRA